jgi:inositol phosphorylceramide mannosyltransferase catalytic subunit
MRPSPTPPQIPKRLHMIWVGDESKRPDQCIQTWRDKHPAWHFKLWGNVELNKLPWQSKRQMEIFRASGHWDGVADLMRYEILNEHGGVYADADSICVRPLDDWLLATRMFVVWESEEHRPGLIANTFIGSVPQHPALAAIVRKTSRMHKSLRRWTRHIERWDGLRPRFYYENILPWKMVGPVFFTKMILPFCPREVTVLPSVIFLPKHFLDSEERQSSLVYARHEWNSKFDHRD